ncbi:MAG TPA: acetate--CoA ligase family protein [Anaerolineae bacterium]|nr:acetate--CoA ligase family protein [Anaerolineae bacterium]HQK14078.1 acetate--CoA ligase family protein [Anaerolineae bacterium]
MTNEPLERYFFNPQGIAVIGASGDPTKLSYGVVRNLITHGYRGPIYPVNPKGGKLQGLTVYPSIAEVPDPVELAVIMVRAEAVPTALTACGERGLKAVIVITGGFREVGPEGAALEAALKPIAAQYGMRLIGPNCVGVMDAHLPLDTTFITMMPEPGSIAFVSHSGAICGGSIDWARSVGVGYSRIASLGNQVDVDIADGIRMMKDDPHTRVISVYAEGLPDGRRFVEAAASVYRNKPIVMLKAGLTAAGSQAVASHTGALAGNNDAYRAACHRAGVVVVHSLQEQNDVAMALATQPLPHGNRVALLTNAGGPAALAADALDRQGLVMAPISAATQERLKAVTPPGTQLGNPIDMLGGPRPEMYSAAGKILLEDPNVDMLMTIFVPQAITSVNEVAQHMVATRDGAVKPVVACLVGGESLGEAIYALNRGGVPYYRDPNRAARALGGLWEYRKLRERPDLTPTPIKDVDRATAQTLLNAAWKHNGAGFLDAETAAQVADAYGIPVPFSGLATTADEAVALAEKAGYPVVLKRIAADVVHKADVGGLALDLRDAEAVRAAFERVTDGGRTRAMVQQMIPAGHEVILGAKRDAQFGPQLMFGMGGLYVEILRDVAFRLAPISAGDARDMIAETAAGRIMEGVRGAPPDDIPAVVETLQRVGQLVSDFPCIAEMDINPLIVGHAGMGAWAVDVRIRIDGRSEG